jgi:hypothetical protein
MPAKVACFGTESFRGTNDLGFTEIDYLKSKSATADLVGGEPGIHNHRRQNVARQRQRVEFCDYGFRLSLALLARPE